MARRSKGPWERKSDGCYYTEHEGRQVNLGPKYAEALKKYHRIKSGQEDADAGLTAAELIDSYLDWVQRRRSTRTYRWYREFLRSFHKHIGSRLLAADVRPFHVDEWLAGYKGWKSDSTLHGGDSSRSASDELGSQARLPDSLTTCWDGEANSATSRNYHHRRAASADPCTSHRSSIPQSADRLVGDWLSGLGNPHGGG
jgi:hypothetical protein